MSAHPVDGSRVHTTLKPGAQRCYLSFLSNTFMKHIRFLKVKWFVEIGLYTASFFCYQLDGLPLANLGFGMPRSVNISCPYRWRWESVFLHVEDALNQPRNKPVSADYFMSQFMRPGNTAKPGM